MKERKPEGIERVEEGAIKVTGIQTLQEEKDRLKKLCHGMEHAADDRVDYLRKHWLAMTLNSVLPNAHPEKQIINLAGAGIKSALESANFRSILLNGAITLIEFIGVRLGVNFFEKYFRKKKAKKEEKEEVDS